jgi:hypothetical protein
MHALGVPSATNGNRPLQNCRWYAIHVRLNMNASPLHCCAVRVTKSFCPFTVAAAIGQTG